MNVAALREYKLLHPAVQRTEDLLDKFSNNDSKQFENRKDVQEMYKSIHERYYKPKISAKNMIGAIFARKVLDLIKVTKHERVRRNPKERAKLDYLVEELRQSPRLKAIETETDHFENTTAEEFTNSITHHFTQIQKDEEPLKTLPTKFSFNRDTSRNTAN
jgi:hypothetical protein